MVDCSY